MADSLSSNGSSLSTGAAAPSIRSFQIDPNGLGGLTQSVNLFRGDINLPITLLTISGRSGLEASATIVYQSNVLKQVDTWNMDAPTGPLGLGWLLGYDFIALEDGGSINPGTDKYYLVSGGNYTRLWLTETGTDYSEFEMEAYQFWQIRYYPASEKWVIIKEDGSQSIFGTTSGSPASDPVQYGIKWGQQDGSWKDSSTRTTGQANYVVAWNLSSIVNTFGDGINFSYENDLITIGGSGLSYTSASRTISVTAPYSRGLHFIYGEKEPYEYQLQHYNPGAPGLHAYQDRYETKYLAKIEMRNDALASTSPGALLTVAIFNYELENISISNQGNDDFKKRYLTSVSMTTANGLPLTGFNFSYFNDPATDLSALKNRGAIKSILYPQGGKVGYEFEATDLSGTSRTLDISPNGTSRMWFGGDYVVYTEYDGTSTLNISIYSWNGNWIKAPQTFKTSNKINPDTLKVSVQSSMFALSFISQATNPYLYTILFHKESGRFGQWIVENDFTALSISNGTQGIVVTGESFAIALTSPGRYFAKTWNERNKSWDDKSNSISVPSSSLYALAANGDYFVLAAFKENTSQVNQSIYYLDSSGNFATGTFQIKTVSSVKWDPGSTPDTYWSPGGNFVVATYVTSGDSKTINYQTQIQLWNEFFTTTSVTTTKYSVDANTKLPYAQTVANGSMVGNLGNLLRYDGLQWDSGTIAIPSGGTDVPKFIFGNDVAIATGNSQANLSLFNPYNLSWKAALNETGLNYTPTISGDYYTLGRTIYYRNAGGALNTIGTLPLNLETNGIFNRAPYFIAYQDLSGNTFVQLLKNGTLNGTPIKLANQKIYNSSSQPGTTLVGTQSFMTYQGDFSNPSKFTLYQFVNDAISGSVTCFPVKQLSIDDGYAEIWGSHSQEQMTRYYYDCANATISSDGSVAEYAAATTVYGDTENTTGVCYPAPDLTALGRSEFRFHNNGSALSSGLIFETGGAAESDYYYSYLNGMLFDQTDYDESGNMVQRLVNYYNVRTKYSTIDAPDVLNNLIGAYVKTVSTETTQYEEPVTLTSISESQNLTLNQHVESHLEMRRYSTHSLQMTNSRFKDRFLVYPYPGRQTCFYGSTKNNSVTLSTGITRTVTYEYSFATGLLFSDKTENYNTEGKLEIYWRQIYYAWQVPAYSILKDRHVWSPTAVSIRFTQGELDTAPGIPTEFSLTTLKAWGDDSDLTQWAPSASWVGLSEQAYDPLSTPPVSFTNWINADTELANWRKVGDVTLRSASSGVLLEATDPMGIPTATIVGLNDNYRIASIPNAKTKEVIFQGFESYENTDGWIASGMELKNMIQQGDSHTGNAAVLIPPANAASLKKSVEMNGIRKYILSFWAKTLTGFGADTGKASWTILDSGGTTVASFEITDTGDAWQYMSFPFQPASGLDSYSIFTLVAENGKSSAGSKLLLDDILFSPLDSSPAVTVYDATYGESIAGLSLNGNTSRTFYDSYRRGMMQSGNQYVKTLTGLFMVRDWNSSTDFVFPQDWPNCVLEINATMGGGFAGLCQGDAWKKEWSSADLSSWNVSNSVLTRSANGTGSVSFVPSQNYSGYGAKVSLIQPVDASGNPVTPTGQTGIALGTLLSVMWTPGTGWQVTLNGNTVALSVPFSNTSTAGFGSEWMLLAPTDPVTEKTSIFFFVNGLLLFSAQDAPAISGALTLTLSDAGFGFTSIGTVIAPGLSFRYLDGSGKELQNIAFDGSGIIVQETVYDQIGRAAIGTKPARMNLTAPNYQPGFVTGFDPESGIMTGLVSELNPDDEGYPYVRSVFKQTAQALVIQQGNSGKDFAVWNIDGSSNPHISTISYGINEATSTVLPPLPPNEYFITKTTDADNRNTIRITTKTDKDIAVLQGPLADGSYITSMSFYDTAQRISKTLPPDGVEALLSGSADAGLMASVYTYDFIGQTISFKTPDSGTTETVYDAAGNPRFVLTAKGNTGGNTNTILYTKYDNLGRKTESGWYTGSWDRAVLSEIALDNPAWPDQTQAHVISSAAVYDGDGTNPLYFGRLVRDTEFSELDASEVISEFEYNAAGKVIRQTTTVTAFDSNPRTVSYTYNLAGAVLSVVYPSGSVIAEVDYTYNMLGQVFALGIPGNKKAFGTFGYTASGALVSSTMNISDTRTLNRQSQYNPAGWPTVTAYTLDDATLVFKETLTYTEGGYNAAGYYSGLIASAGVDYSAADFSSYRYAYDPVSRITVAENTSDASLSLGVLSPLTYDSNGNFTSVQKGTASPELFNYKSGTDQVTTITLDGTQVDSFTYNANGYVTAAERIGADQISYETDSNLVSEMEISKDGTTKNDLSFVYDSSGNRLVKFLKDENGSELKAQLYSRGSDGLPLTEEKRADGTTATSQYLYGPDGLSGMQLGAKRYTVIKDHLGSIRKVIDETGATVAAFDYTPFGITITKAGSTDPDIIFYRFTGQELDPESGLYAFPARMYDPETGRFLGTDPKQVGGTPYAYVLNNPSNLIDPNGEEPLTAFLIIVIVSAIIGAIAGAVTYAVSHSGSFDVGEFFAYTLVGAVAGALGGATGYGAGVLATAGLAAAGVSTSTSIASGVVVGAVSGAVDGAVSGSLNQVGVNLIEKKPAGEGVGMSALMGAGIGAVMGGLAGGITGKLNARTASGLTTPNRAVSGRIHASNYYDNIGALDSRSYQAATRQDILTEISDTAQASQPNRSMAIGGHGSSSEAGVYFENGVDLTIGPNLEQRFISAQEIGDALVAGNFRGNGLDLSTVCYPARNGTSRALANRLNVPVRGANVPAWAGTDANYISKWDTFFGAPFQAGTFRTYYPSKLQTGWIALFGY